MTSREAGRPSACGHSRQAVVRFGQLSPFLHVDFHREDTPRANEWRRPRIWRNVREAANKAAKVASVTVDRTDRPHTWFETCDAKPLNHRLGAISRRVGVQHIREAVPNPKGALLLVGAVV